MISHSHSRRCRTRSALHPLLQCTYVPVSSSRRSTQRLSLWLRSLAALAAVNVGIWIWIWIARSVPLDTPYGQSQLLLSGVYVGVCGFRSVFPRVDLERVCVWDTWLSAILLGRTAATIAEICFALQCALFLQRLSDIADIPVPNVAAHAFVPLVIVAELVCWYAVLSLNHIGHAIEETLWAVLMLMLSAALGLAALTAHGLLRAALLAGLLVYGVGAGLTLAVDVRMYLRRWRRKASGLYLTLASGSRDSRRRRHPTFAWDVWREEVPWMTHDVGALCRIPAGAREDERHDHADDRGIQEIEEHRGAHDRAERERAVYDCREQPDERAHSAPFKTPTVNSFLSRCHELPLCSWSSASVPEAAASCHSACPATTSR